MRMLMAVRMMMFVLVLVPSLLYGARAGADGRAASTGTVDADIIDSAAAAGNRSTAGHPSIAKIA